MSEAQETALSGDDLRITKKTPELRLIPTYRPVELMFAATGKEPKDFSGKSILNIGAGKTHWGFELTKKYGVVAKRLENFDIAYTQQSLPKRLIGKALLAETAGDIKSIFPYKDESFNFLWCSFAPTNWEEFLRVIKPGGEIFVLGGNLNEAMAESLTKKLGVTINCKDIKDKDIAKWREKTDKRHRGALDEISGKKILVIKKPISPAS